MKLRNLLFAVSVATMGVVEAQDVITPIEGAANVFAYNLSSVEGSGIITVNYSLNTDAQGVTLVVKDCRKSEPVITMPLAGDLLLKGSHTTSFDLSAMPSSCYCWELQVTGTVHETVEQFASWKFYYPTGLDVDNSIESPSFGTLFIANGQTTTNQDYYCGVNGGSGLYMFTPDGQGIKNSVTDTYRFYGDNLTYDRAYGSSYGGDFNHVAVADDGRVFVSRYNTSGDYLLSTPSVAQLAQEGRFTSLVEGKTMTNVATYNDADGNYLLGAVQSFDVKGAADSTRIVALTRTINVSTAEYKYNRAVEYEIGNDVSLTTALPVASLDGKYLMTSDMRANVAYDKAGGMWFVQHSSTPDDENPSLVYVNNGKVRYFEGAGGKERRRGAIAVSQDGNRLAVASSTTEFTVYDVTMLADSTVTLTEQCTVAHGLGSNLTALAWDAAGNLYAASTSSRIVNGYSIPQNSNTVTTKAAAQYAICYTSPVAPLYAVGEGDALGAWEPENAVEFTYDGTAYVLNVTEPATQFKISTFKGEWEIFNAGNLKAMAEIANGVAVGLTRESTNDNIVLPWPGNWTITVASDFSSLTATTDTPQPNQYPDQIYAIGNIDGHAWDTSCGTSFAHTGDGVYHGSVTVDNSGNGFGYFQFATTLSSVANDWDTVNSRPRYGALTADEEITLGTPTTMTNDKARATQSWKLAAKKYIMTVDLAQNVLTVIDGTTDGIDKIETDVQNAETIYYNLQGAEVRRPVAGNLYIVSRGGKVTKEIAR